MNSLIDKKIRVAKNKNLKSCNKCSKENLLVLSKLISFVQVFFLVRLKKERYVKKRHYDLQKFGKEKCF